MSINFSPSKREMELEARAEAAERQREGNWTRFKEENEKRHEAERKLARVRAVLEGVPEPVVLNAPEWVLELSAALDREGEGDAEAIVDEIRHPPLDREGPPPPTDPGKSERKKDRAAALDQEGEDG
jgi:protein involved in temperature-dependent protein secretion